MTREQFIFKIQSLSTQRLTDYMNRLIADNKREPKDIFRIKFELIQDELATRKDGKF